MQALRTPTALQQTGGDLNIFKILAETSIRSSTCVAARFLGKLAVLEAQSAMYGPLRVPKRVPVHKKALLYKV